jgi:hypothetical protein
MQWCHPPAASYDAAATPCVPRQVAGASSSNLLPGLLDDEDEHAALTRKAHDDALGLLHGGCGVLQELSRWRPRRALQPPRSARLLPS